MNGDYGSFMSKFYTRAKKVYPRREFAYYTYSQKIYVNGKCYNCKDKKTSVISKNDLPKNGIMNSVEFASLPEYTRLMTGDYSRFGVTPIRTVTSYWTTGAIYSKAR